MGAIHVGAVPFSVAAAQVLIGFPYTKFIKERLFWTSRLGRVRFKHGERRRFAMGRAIALRNGFDAAALRQLAKNRQDGPQSRGLLSLAAIYDQCDNALRLRRLAASVFRLSVTGYCGSTHEARTGCWMAKRPAKYDRRKHSSSSVWCNDVPRGTMDEVSSHVRLDLPSLRRQGRPIDCSTSSSNTLMEGPLRRVRREARAHERHRTLQRRIV